MRGRVRDHRRRPLQRPPASLLETPCRGDRTALCGSQLATLAEATFGVDTYPALETRAAHLAAVASDLRHRKFRDFDTPYESTLEAGTALLDVNGKVRDRYREQMNPGAWLEFMNMLSARLDEWAREIADSGDLERCRMIQRQLGAGWVEAFTRLGVNPLTRPPHVLKQRGRGIATSLQDWVALAIRMTDAPSQPRRSRVLHQLDTLERRLTDLRSKPASRLAVGDRQPG
jgi:hypothetical protein